MLVEIYEGGDDLLREAEDSQLTDDIWVYAEYTPQKLHNVTGELLGAAEL